MASENIEKVISRVEDITSETTGVRYGGSIRKWAQWCNQEDRNPFAATSIDVEDYLRYTHEEKDYAYSTVNLHMAAIKRFFEAADQLSQMGQGVPSPRAESPANRWKNPAEDAKLRNAVTKLEDRKYTKKERALQGTEGKHGLNAEQVERVLENTPSPKLRNQAIIQLAYQGMLRRNEVVKLKVDDITFENQSIHIRPKVSKNGQERYTYYQSNLNSTLRSWVNVDRESYAMAPESEYLFLSNQKKNLGAWHVGDMFRRASLDADIGQEVLYTDAAGRERYKYTFHSLRHAGAVRRWENGADLRTLQLLLGHEDISTTETYLDVEDDAIREKAKATW